MMKHLLLLLVGLLAFASCKKEDEPAPVASARVAGTYELTRIAYDSVGTRSDYDLTLPQSISGVGTVSGTMDVQKFNNRDDAVTILITVKQPNRPDARIDLEDFDLTGTGTTLDLTYTGQKLGTADGKTINLDFSTSLGRYIFQGRRQ